MLDVESLTLGEVAKIEELSGQSITVIGDDERPKGLMMAALLFITKRREDPAYTWNAACGTSMAEATAALGFDEAQEPAEEAAAVVDPPQAPGRRARTSSD